MAETFTNLIYHIVFSTKNRQPLITGANQSRLYDYVGGTIRDLGGISLAINGTEDHVHLLAKLRPDKALSDVLRDLKANASGWMRGVFPDLKDFPGNAVTERSRSVNRTLRKRRIILRGRKSIIRKNLSETSS